MTVFIYSYKWILVKMRTRFGITVQNNARLSQVKFSISMNLRVNFGRHEIIERSVKRNARFCQKKVLKIAHLMLFNWLIKKRFREYSKRKSEASTLRDKQNAV